MKKITLFLNFFLTTFLLYFLFSNYPLNNIFNKIFLARRLVNIIEFELLFFGLYYYKFITSTIKDFFTNKQHPLNLAIIRIAIFWILGTWDLSQTQYYSRAPLDLLMVPKGLIWLTPLFRFDPQIILILSIIFKIFCAASILGIFTRCSMIISTLLGLYLLGIPQLFGKINHYHHVIWFAMILSVSPCHHALTISQYLLHKGQKSVSHGLSAIYNVPIRLMWILIGYLYFSAGFPKWWFNGIDWVFSNNLAYRMYFKWIEFPGIWTPAFRIDQYPILLQMSALSVILFEVSFIFLIFFPKWRYVAVAGGLLFHQMTSTFMRINFGSLKICYIVFFDWYRILRWFSLKVFKKELFADREHQLLSQLSIRKYVFGPVLVSTLLIIGNFYCGARGIHSWPMTTYPAFYAVFHKPYFARVVINVQTPTGEIFSLRNHTVIQKMGKVRYFSMIDEILTIENIEERNRRLTKLWEMFQKTDPTLRNFESVKFYRATFTFIPENRHKNPLSKKIILEIRK